MDAPEDTRPVGATPPAGGGVPEDRELVLVRDARVATAWGVPAALLVVAGVWLLLDSAGGPVGIASFVIFLLVAAVFVVPWLAPNRHAVRFDDVGVTLVVPWRARQLPWTNIQTIRLSKFAGDPFLEVETLDGKGGIESVGMLLPVGADVAAAHEWLQRRQSTHPFPGAVPKPSAGRPAPTTPSSGDTQ